MEHSGRNFVRWQKFLLRTNILIAVIIAILEGVLSEVMYYQGLITRNKTIYYIRYLVFPNVINWSLILLMILIMVWANHMRKKKKLSPWLEKQVDKHPYFFDDIINAAMILTLTGICGVAAFVHCVYKVTMVLFGIPIFLCIVFYSVTICRLTIGCSYIGILLIAVHRWFEPVGADGNDMLILETVLSLIFIGFTGYISRVAITKLKEQDQELVQARETAEIANRAKSDFLARMSHEIRTPINTIVGMNEMILRESEQPDIRKYAVDVKQSASTLLSIINDILDISKIESGKMEILPVRYSLSSLIYDSISIISIRAKDKGLTLDIDVDENLPGYLWGDDVRIRQVLCNLLTNAVKYTHKGVVKLSVEGKQDEEDLLVHFQVQDTGIGIKETDLPKLTQKFQRLDMNKNRNIEGTGLGMSIVVQLLDLMGSQLEIKSVYGEGSTFGFTLRQKVVDSTPVGNVKSKFEEAVNDVYKDGRLSFVAPNAKILVVDDNEMNLKVFTNLLKHTGIQIDTATSGKECIARSLFNRYDIIFLDHMMPDMDGVETLSEIHTSGANASKFAPVVALTANAVAGAREEYLKNGFTDYLSKPIAYDKLEKMIISLLPKEMTKRQVIMDREGKADRKTENHPWSVPVGLEMPDLPEVEGINWKYAMMILQDGNLLKDIATSFYKSIEENLEFLLQKVEHIEEAKELREFQIKMHSLKTSAGTIGAFALQELAKFLEKAAEEQDVEMIRTHMPYLEQLMLVYKELLRSLEHD